MSKSAYSYFAVLLAMTCAVPAGAEQAADHPLVGRFEASQIIDYTTTDFDEYVLLTRKYTGSAEWGEAGKEQYGRTLEGKVTRITYESPNERTTLEVMRAYEEALAGEGFEVLYECDDAECGGRDFSQAVIPYNIVMSENHEDQRYLAARKQRPAEGDVYVSIYTVKAYSTGGERKNRVYTQVDVVEIQPRETEVVVVKADEMARQMDESGSVALYGLYFDVDKATIKPASRPTLDEIGKLMADNPELQLLVVGHTDNQGGFEYNIDLSKRRAASVTDALVNDQGIQRSRLKPWGVGYTAPVASNASEEGRAKNRRVELVKH
ncbi:MAG: DUF4892 domain-containing protein [Gammaproteobacteria bacterium]|nr:DUF4892 domain-containing protein [Gammaproteobacteria bacterium]